MTVGQLKELLNTYPDEFEIVSMDDAGEGLAESFSILEGKNSDFIGFAEDKEQWDELCYAFDYNDELVNEEFKINALCIRVNYE